jgi:type VI secretion system protein ImpG
VPFDDFSPQGKGTPVYHLTVKRSATKAVSDVFMSVAYPPEMKLATAETLSIQLECTNGNLPESLQVGDVSVPTSDSPEFAEFKNIRAPSATVLPPLGKNLLWSLLSHLSLNYSSLAKAENLRAVLEMYIFSETRDRGRVTANKKRVAGIQEVRATPSSKLVSGVMMRGQDIVVHILEDHFSGAGDLFLFGSVLDSFLGAYATMNSYTQLIVEEASKGDQYRWPARIGEHFLI